jgi:primosomal replication protein N
MTVQSNPLVAATIELCGRLANLSALRVTPAGTPVLKLSVDCGAKAGSLLMPVVITGEMARTVAAQLSAGVEVRVHGSLQQVPRQGLASLGVEVVADEITLVNARK